MDKKAIINYFKTIYHIIIPIGCICFWALISLLKDNFNFIGVDFNSFYYAGYYLINDPSLLYSNIISPPYNYLPLFALLMIPYALFSFEVSAKLFFITILCSSIINIIIFDKYLILKKISQKSRLLFLLIVSNGILYYAIFDVLQTKFFVIGSLFLFLYREEKSNKEGLQKNLKFYFIQYSILWFAIALAPYIIFLLFIYIVYDKKIKELFKKEELKKDLVCITAFIIQNFLFLVFPYYVIDFLGGFNTFSDFHIYINLTLPLAEGFDIAINSLENIFTILNYMPDPSMIKWLSLGLTIVGVLIIILLKNKTLEQKFGYFAINMLAFSIISSPSAKILFLNMIIFLFITDIFIEKSLFTIIKKHLFIIIGLLMIIFLSFFPPLYFLYKVLPVISIIPINFIIMLPTLALVLIIFSSIMQFKKLD